MSGLALRLIEENKRTKDTFLDLGNCNLKYELPKALANCIWLERLNLSSYYYDSKQNNWIDSKNKKSLNRFNGQELAILAYLPQLHTLDLRNNQIKDYSFLEKLPQLQVLDLISNQIQDISFLEKLKNLHTLDLSSNLIKDYSILEKLPQLRAINLRNNLIKDYSFLEKLPQLQKLDLGFSQIQDYGFIEKLTQLKELYLRKNLIKDYGFLEKLPQLQTLNLRDNQINDISFLEKTTQLHSLNLQSNQIKDINSLEQFTQLHSLNLRDNQIQNNKTLEKLAQLRKLDLGYNQINDISFLEKFSQLKTLDLSNNQIQKYSFLEKLTQLKELYLTRNQIQDISFLKDLTQLHLLDLSSNKIKNISSLENLKQLQKLDLNNNQILNISFLSRLTQLQLLVLCGNKIQDIRPIEKLAKLETLDLRDNQIQTIKSLLNLVKRDLKVNLDRLGNDGVLLHNNPIINPPIEILKQGTEAIVRYFERVEQQGNEFIFEAKLTLVGDGGAGKTSLQRRIIDDKAELPTGNDRTRGIKVHNWQFNDVDKKIYTSHIWDFGGQDIYYPVHRFFLTENSVYILMASTRYSVHNFEYWIPTIYQFGGESPIIPVQTCDNGNQNAWTDVNPFYGIGQYNLKPIYRINLNSPDNWGLENLKGYIQHQISELPHIGKSVPGSWVKVREQLIEKAEAEDFISYEKFSDLCIAVDKAAFSKAVDIEDVGRFLHDIGIILWYYNKELLKNFIILKPEWVMNAVYKIIDDTIIQEKNGVISQTDFERIWGEEIYKTKIGELKLMLRFFKIAFPKQHQPKDYLLPARLIPIPDKKLWPNHENALRLEYRFDFMPRGIVNQLSADLSNKIESDETVWSNAVILQQDTSYSQIVEETYKKRILIKAKGHDARGLMLLIMNSLINIINEYRGVEPLLRVPCHCEKCQTLENPTIFKYEKLIAWLNEGKVNVSCDESETKLPISKLLYSVGLENIEKEKEKITQLQTETVEYQPVKVFITYSWTDKDGNIDKAHQIKVQKLVNTLRTSYGFDATFDRYLNAQSTATDFMRMMVENFQKHEKVIVVLSEGYAIKADDFIGGVGNEYQLLIKDINKHPNKYVFVSFSGRGDEIYPLALSGRDTIDLSELDLVEMESLIRKLEGSSAFVQPTINKKYTLPTPEDVGGLFDA